MPKYLQLLDLSKLTLSERLRLHAEGYEVGRFSFRERLVSQTPLSRCAQCGGSLTDAWHARLPAGDCPTNRERNMADEKIAADYADIAKRGMLQGSI